MIRIGVVGLRFGARIHAAAFCGDSRCVVTGLAGRTLDNTRTVAAELGIPGAYGGWRELLAEGAIDAVSIAVPPSEQPAIIVEAARRGIHVFCEKPLAATVAAAEAAVDAVRAFRVVHAMDFIFPEIPAWQQMRDLLVSGAIGPVQHFSYGWHVETSASRLKEDSWKTRSGEGQGVVANFVPHIIFNIEWLLGPIAEIETLRPRGTRTAASFCDCVMHLEGGVHGTVSVSADAYLGEGHRVVVFGESGTMELRNTTADHAGGFELRFGTRETGRFDALTRDAARSEGDGRIAPVGRIAGRFLDGITGGGVPTPNLADGLRIQRWLERLNDAHAG